MQGLFKRASVSLLALMLVLPAAANAQTAKTVPESQMQMQLSFAPLVKQTSGAVVNVYAEKTVRRQSPFAGDPFFEQFFGQQMPNRSEKQSSLGSGVIVEANGTVVTNNHVVEGADDIKVALPDGREFPCKVVLRDDRVDLAVLKIDTKESFPTLPIGNSDAVEVGDLVLAIGNPFGVGQTVTSGIVSALGRNSLGINIFENFIQTDAAINPGNSGGALVSARGELVGINTAIFTQSGGYQGIGFAVPSNLVRHIVDELQRYGEVRRGSIGYLEVAPLTTQAASELNAPSADGVVITGLRQGPASRAGLEQYDIILSVDGRKIGDTATLLKLISDAPIGSSVSIEVLRDGRRQTFKVPIERQGQRMRPRVR